MVLARAVMPEFGNGPPQGERSPHRPGEQVEALVARTLGQATPTGDSRWSERSMAGAEGMSNDLETGARSSRRPFFAYSSCRTSNEGPR